MFHVKQLGRGVSAECSTWNTLWSVCIINTESEREIGNVGEKCMFHVEQVRGGYKEKLGN
jgi:hypothetical protein